MRRLHMLVKVLATLFSVFYGVTILSASDGFQAGRSYPAGLMPQIMAVADFNNDGKLDVVVVSSSGTPNNVSVLLGNGDATFQPPISMSAGGSLDAVAVGDFNKDGNLDLAVADNSNSAVMVLLGNGDGTFAAPTSSCSTGAQPVAIAVADLNGDGKLDFVTANEGTQPLGANSVTVCMGNGAGGFSSSSTFVASTIQDFPNAHPNGVAIADVTGDGKPDIIVSVSEAAYSILRGNGDGTFGVPNTQPIVSPASGPNSVKVADLNSDGKPDLVFPTGDGTCVFLGNGDGTFQAQTVYQGPGSNAVIADLNGDGRLDIVTVDFIDGVVSVLANLGGGKFSSAIQYASGDLPDSLAVADLNGDGQPDVIAANENSSIAVLLGNGDTTLRGALNFHSDIPGRLSSEGAVVTADFNGDGVPDAAVLNTGSSSVTIFLADPTLGFKPGETYDSSNGIVANGDLEMTAGDVNGDGKTDIVTIGVGGIHILPGEGDGTFGEPSALPNAAIRQGVLAVSIVVADLDGDGNTDIAYTQTGMMPDKTFFNELDVQYGDGKGNFTTPVIYPSTGFSPTAIRAADFNMDGKIDLVTGNASVTIGGSTVTVFLNQGSRAFSPSTPYFVGPLGAAALTVSLEVADVDNNGVPDLVVAEDGNGQASQSFVTVLRNDGTGAFTTAAQYSTGTFLSDIATGDFDGDGELDIAVSGSSMTYVFPGSGGGALGTPVAYAVGGGGEGIVAAQFNSGGAPDLAVASSDVSALLLLLNAAGTHATFASTPNPSAYGQPVSMAAAFMPEVKWAGLPSGTLKIQDGAATLGTVSLDNTQTAEYSISNLAVGTHQITATYSGDNIFAPRSFSVPQIVNRATPVLEISSSGSPSLTGSPVTFSAAVIPPYAGQPSGTMTLMEDQNTLASQPVDASAQTQFTLPALSAGPHTLVFAYGGDNNFNAATNSFSQDIQNGTTLSLQSSADSGIAGGNLTYTATIASEGAPAPTGTISFDSDGTALGTAALESNGNAVLTTATPGGTHAITATYSGDIYSAAAASNPVSVSIADFGASASSLSATVRAGQSTTFTITVKSLASFSGPVSFACAGVPLFATCSFSPVAVTPPTNGSATVQMTLATAGPAATLRPPVGSLPNRYFGFMIFGPIGVFGIFILPATQRRRRLLWLLTLSIGLAEICIGCGGGNAASNPPPGPVTPSGSDPVTVTMSANVNGVTLTHNLQVNLTVTQ